MARNIFNKTYNLLFVIILICSCSSNDEKQNKTVNTEVKKDFFDVDIRGSIGEPEELYLSNLADKIDYIPLGTNQSCVLSEIRYLKIFDNNIFILDKKAVYKFDIEGKFIQQIGRVGNGPGEYGMVLYFTIIEKLKEILLFCYPSGMVNVYDYETGTLKRNFKPGLDIQGMIEFPPKSIAFFNTNLPHSKNDSCKNEVYLFTSEGEMVDSIPNSRVPFKGNLSGRTIYYSTDSSFCYMENYQDTLILISGNNKRRPYVSFNLSNSVNGNDIKLEPKFGEIQFPDFLSINNILENDDYFLFEIQSGLGLYIEDKILRFLYNKKSDQLIHCLYLTNDIDEGMAIWPQYSCNDTLLIDVKNAYQIIDFFDSNKMKNDKSEEFNKMASNLKENDNPVLFLVKLK